MTDEKNKPLSLWRYRWETHPATHDRDAEEQGTAFRAVRRACGLTVLEVALFWGVAVLDVEAVEAGRRAFSNAMAFRAALNQLWLWGSERGMRG